MKELFIERTAICYDIWKQTLAWTKQWKKDMRFGTWNVRSLYRVGAIKSVVGELEKYKI
jgi:hypothetical protein